MVKIKSCLCGVTCSKTKVPPWFAIQVGSVVETVGAKIRTFSILTKYFLHIFLICSYCQCIIYYCQRQKPRLSSLNFHLSHPSFPLFALLPPPFYRDNPTPNTPVTHPRRPPEADKARFRFSSPLYFCAVFQSLTIGAHTEPRQEDE